MRRHASQELGLLLVASDPQSRLASDHWRSLSRRCQIQLYLCIFNVPSCIPWPWKQFILENDLIKESRQETKNEIGSSLACWSRLICYCKSGSMRGPTEVMRACATGECLGSFQAFSSLDGRYDKFAEICVSTHMRSCPNLKDAMSCLVTWTSS